MTDEKAELDRQRKELEAKYRAFRAREATVVRQAEQLASGQSRLADERSQLDRKTVRRRQCGQHEDQFIFLILLPFLIYL